MADLSKITCPDGTTVDILSKTTRGIVRGIMDDTNSTSTSFVISAPGINSLYDGATFICRNTKVTSASGCVMDVNGLGAKDMWLSQSDSGVTTHWTKGYEIIWVYDATNEYWVYYQGRGTSDTSSLQTTYARFNIAGNGIKQYSLFASIGCDQYSSFTTDSGTGTKTYDTTTEFDFSKIYYHSSSSDRASGARLTTNSVMYWGAQLVNLRYTLNGVTTSTSSSSLTKTKPVYLVFTPTHGSYGRITSPYFIQDIAADGVDNRVYVLIGWTYDSYRADLTIVNTAYIKWINPDDNTDVRVLPWVPGTTNCAALNEAGTTLASSHVEGINNVATKAGSHAEGSRSKATAIYAHAEGYKTVSSSYASHSEGEQTIAASRAQHAGGKFNIQDSSNTYAEIIGNGTDGNSRSNARTLDWSGNESLLGNLKFMECDATTPVSNYPVNMIEPGIMWKEKGYGDKFEIKPKFYGSDDENKLMVNASYGAAGTNPDVATVMHIDPLGDFGFGRDVHETWWNFNCTSSTNNVKIKITLPSNNWAKYHIEVIATANFGYIHSRVFVGMNDQNAINQCGYTNETPTWTTVSGCSAVSNNATLTWTADKTNRVLTSSAFAKYGMAMIRITSSIDPVYNRIRVERIDG